MYDNDSSWKVRSSWNMYSKELLIQILKRNKLKNIWVEYTGRYSQWMSFHSIFSFHTDFPTYIVTFRILCITTRKCVIIINNVHQNVKKRKNRRRKKLTQFVSLQGRSEHNIVWWFHSNCLVECKLVLVPEHWVNGYFIIHVITDNQFGKLFATAFRWHDASIKRWYDKLWARKSCTGKRLLNYLYTSQK